MNDFQKEVTNFIRVLKGDSSLEIQGRNKNIERWYSVWKGKPDWLPYNVRLPDGTVKEEKYKSLNLPKYICRTWANNYANEETTLTVPNENSNTRLNEIISEERVMSKFNSFCESFMGLGIGATVVMADMFLEDEEGIKPSEDSNVRISFIGGRRVYPISVDDGEITECAFVSFFTGGAKIQAHYLNENGTYNIAEVKGVGKNGNYAFELVPENIKVVETKSEYPLFQIWQPNIVDEDEIENNYGTSILSSALDAFWQCDLGYTAFYKEVKLGQKTKFISTSLRGQNDDGRLKSPINLEDESVFFVPQGEDAIGGTDKPVMQEFNGDLRIQQLQQFLNANMNAAAMLCGLGQTTFEFDSAGGGRPIQTATGVIAKQTELYRNIIKQENLARYNFQKMVRAIAFVNNEYTAGAKIVIDKLIDVQVMFEDNIMENTQSKKEQELKEVAAGTLSVAEYRSHWYDEDYDSALEFLQEHGMLISTYLPALQSGAMLPEQFVNLVYGENCEFKDELIEQISTASMIAPSYESEEEDNPNPNPKKEEDEEDDE